MAARAPVGYVATHALLALQLVGIAPPRLVRSDTAHDSSVASAKSASPTP
jgi:hypothetical protein